MSSSTPLDPSRLDEAQRAARNLNILLRVISSVNSGLDIEAHIISAIDITLDLTGAERGILLLEEAGGLRVRLARDSRQRNLPPNIHFSHSIPKKVANEGRALCLLDAASEVSVDKGQSVVELRLLTVMCVPLRVRERPIGVLYVDSKATTREFRHSDLEVLAAMANVVALTIDNARLLTYYLDNQKIQHSLDIAKSIQRGLLPTRAPLVPAFEVIGCSVDTGDIGGHYFDYISLSDGRLGVAVGDVAGRGIGAAMYTVSARAFLRAFVQQNMEPEAALVALNNMLVDDMESGRFMSMVYGTLDPRTRSFTYVRAGHQPPVVYRASTGTLEALDAPGICLGLLRDFQFRATSTQVREGDVLFILTDPGEDVAAGASLMESCCTLIREACACTAQEITATLQKAISAAARGKGVEHSVTFLIAKGCTS